MFLINGISYLFSASTEIFIKIPNVVSEKSKGTFREDFKDGIHFVLRYEGMIRVIVMSVSYTHLEIFLEKTWWQIFSHL